MRAPAAPAVVETSLPDDEHSGDDRVDEPAPSDDDAPAASPEEALPTAPDDVVSAATRPEVEREAGSTDPAAEESVEPDAESRDVSALFDQLRSEAVAPEAESDDAALGFDATPEAAVDLEVEIDREADEPTGDQALLAARDEALASPLEDLARRAKRALQDEQNDILDGVRRQRGKIDTGKVLPQLDDQLARWAHVIQPGIDRAYAVGAGTVGATTDRAPAPVLAELSGAVVNPLRERLASALASIDEPTPADTEIAIAQRLGARYREWRSQHLDPMLADVMAAAHAQGVYDAAPEGSRLRWVPVVVGKCPDCDDNALEPTVRGNDFPTGQAHPPAHPGCRCLIVVDTDN